MSTSTVASPSYSRKRRPAAIISVALVALVSLILTSAADHLLASWLGITHPGGADIGVYRRIGPESGPQALATGSSLLVSAFSWSEVSKALHQGIETWGVAGSSPDVWEEWQRLRPKSNTTIIGISAYDLNEMHLAPDRANVVPLMGTIRDLWASGAESSLSNRVIAQYMLHYLRLLFPTAEDSEKVLIGFRTKAAQLLGRHSSLEEYEGVVVQPKPPLLDAGQAATKLTDWSSARLVRRLAALRTENEGREDFFNGPKRLALVRLLRQAQQQGRVIIAVLPVSQPYIDEFLDKNSSAAFEKAIDAAVSTVPDATLVRLDRVPGISKPENFFDLVHMNSLGRRIVTDAFLEEITRVRPARSLNAMSNRP